MSKLSFLRVLTFIVALSMIFTACTPAAQPTAAPAAAEPTKASAPAQAEPTKAAVEPTKAEAAAPAAGEDYSKADRKDTVIFDIDGGRVTSPDLFNYLVPGGRRD